MKAKFIAAAIPALFMANAFAAIEGESGTVNFTGQIVESTCSIAPGNNNQTVDLGQVSANAFGGQGGATSAKNFSIKLADCNTEIASQASVLFSGETANDTALKTSEGDATNVGIQILQNGTALKLDGVTPSAAQDLIEGENSLDFAARYVALSDEVAAGEANATANFTLQYE